MCKGASSLKNAATGGEANHSPSPEAEVKNAWSYTSTSPHAFLVYTNKILPYFYGMHIMFFKDKHVYLCQWLERIPLDTCNLLQNIAFFITSCMFRPKRHVELSPWNIVFLERLTDSQLVKKFPSFYGTGRFIIAFTRACHLSPILSQIDPVHAPTSHLCKAHH